MEEKLTSAKYSEWSASLFGAAGIALGLGVMLADYLKAAAVWLILVGILLHSWGMYKMHQRNK